MQASQADIDCLQMLSQLFATHQKLKSLRFKQFHFSFVNSKIWKETSESRNFAAIKQFNKMKKKFIILPVVAMLMVCGFSACSQDDDLFEYDLGNDEVATLAKRSMPRNGESLPGGSGGSQPVNPSWSCIAEEDYDGMISFIFRYQEWGSHSLGNGYYELVSGVNLDIKAYRRQKVKDEEKDENNDQATYEYHATVNFNPYGTHNGLRLTNIWSAPGFNNNKLSHITVFFTIEYVGSFETPSVDRSHVFHFDN